MSGAELGLAVSVFLACAVEAVEALTIVLAVGATRSWTWALGGLAAAILALAMIVLVLGPAITSLPIDVLRVFVGGLLLIFGLQWLSKAILRSAGLKAKHDELLIYEREADAANAAGGRHVGFDAYSFAISFKGVFLEGLEVVFIVLTFGANQHRVSLAAGAAGIAVLTVAVVGFAARAPLAKVPENALKLGVGVMLTSFGMFWAAEGAGTDWPGGEAALLAIIPGVFMAATAIAGLIRRVAARRVGRSALDARPRTAPIETRAVGGKEIARGLALPYAVWEFIVGDDWRTAIGVVLALALTALVAEDGVTAWWIMPAAVLGLLALSTQRAARASRRGTIRS
ncbi:MAG TPA: hypothetical protein VGH60_11095 [Solirubrobacteraceae bacterium]|jgi:uncharacterized membrane protein